MKKLITLLMALLLVGCSSGQEIKGGDLQDILKVLNPWKKL